MSRHARTLRFTVAALTLGVLLSAVRSPLAAPLPNQSVLSGRIVDWPQGQTGELKLVSDVDASRPGEVFATAKIDAAGNFVLPLPSGDLLVSTLARLDGFFGAPSTYGAGECTGQGTVKPEGVRSRTFLLIAFTNGQEVGDVRLRSSAGRADRTGEVTADVWYFSEPATLKGRVSCPFEVSDWDSVVTRGWDLLPARTVSQGEQFTQQYRDATLPAGMQWRLFEEFGGVGLRFNIDPNGQGMVVEAVTAGMPAERGGIRVGDVMTEIDGRPLQGLKQLQVVNLLVGAVNTQVKFVVRRGSEVKQVVLTRALVRAP